MTASFRNVLSANPDLTVAEMLCSSAINATGSERGVTFKNWLGKEDQKENDGHIRLHTLIDFALSRDRDETVKDKGLKHMQPNKNAVKLLTRVSMSMRAARESDETRYLMKRLRYFYKSEEAHDSTFAGLFERTLILVLREEVDWLVDDTFGDDFVLREFLLFMAEHIDKIAYRTILCEIGNASKVLGFVPEYTMEGRNPEVEFFKDMMTYAARRVFAAYDLELEHGRDDMVFDVGALMRSKGREWFALHTGDEKHCALNCERAEIPNPSYTLDIERTQQEMIRNETKVNERKAQVGYVKQEGVTLSMARRQAYLLLSIMSNVTEYNYGLWKTFVDETILKMLLICGVYADPVSIVSSEAFRVLKIIVYGGATPGGEFNVDPMTEDEMVSSRIREIVADIADEIEFSDKSLTPQMIAAFPMFWNHRYKNLDRKDTKYEVIEYHMEKKPEARPRPVMGGSAVIKYERPEGTTPMELYAHLLLDQPALSDNLNSLIMQMLRVYDKEVVSVKAGSSNNWDEYQRNVIAKDAVYFELFRTKFEYNNKLTDMSVIGEAIPLSPFDEYWKETLQRYDVVLNGHVYDFLSFMRCSANWQFIFDQSRIDSWMAAKNPLGNVSSEAIRQLRQFETIMEKFSAVTVCTNHDYDKLLKVYAETSPANSDDSDDDDDGLVQPDDI